MGNEEFDHTINEGPIPDIFQSTDTKKPFETCIQCNKFLLGAETEYLIEKAVKQYEGFEAREVIFEYAVCMDCAGKMRESLSAESLQAIMNYFSAKVNILGRSMDIDAKGDLSLDDWLGNCLVNQTPIAEASEYQIFAHCKGNQMLFTHLPYAISGEAMEEVSELISKKTRDELDGFIDKHFGGPPEFRELLKDNKFVPV